MTHKSHKQQLNLRNQANTGRPVSLRVGRSSWQVKSSSVTFFKSGGDHSWPHRVAN